MNLEELNDMAKLYHELMGRAHSLWSLLEESESVEVEGMGMVRLVNEEKWDRLKKKRQELDKAWDEYDRLWAMYDNLSNKKQD